MHGSSLTVAWFAEPFFDEPLRSFIAGSVREVPREQKAQDFEF